MTDRERAGAGHWPFLALAVLTPVGLIAAMTLTLRADPFGIFDMRYIVIFVHGLPITALLITFVLAVRRPVRRRVPILTALWIACAGFAHFWLWVQFAAGV